MAEYLTQIEASDLLRVSEKTLERMRVEGSGPIFRKAGRRVLYTQADIAAWLDQHKFVSTTQKKGGGHD